MAEIAGLVLGAVPLLIAALEHYQDFVEPTVAFFQWKGQLSKVTRRLLMGHTAYEQNVRLLLKHAVSDEDLVDMIDNPQSRLWTTSTLVEDLRSKLGHAYPSSISTIQEIADIMVCIAAGLDIEGSNKVTQHGLEAIVFANPPLSTTNVFRQRFYFRQRVSFTMKRRALNEKLGQLDECNERLYGFLEKAGKIQDNALGAEGGSRVHIRFVAPLQNIKDNACRVHRVLCGSWCASHESHRAGLLLEQRLLRRRRRNWKGHTHEVGTLNCFGISVWRESALTWLDTEFSLEEDENTTPSSSQVPTQVPRVAFSSAGPAAAMDQPRLKALEVTDICSRVQAAAHPHVGFCLDSSDTLRGLYEVQSQPRRLAADCISLDQLLPALKQRDVPLLDLYSLAITLVCSVLQLGETPWLGQPWSKQDILFLRLRENGEEAVDIKHPYLTSGHGAAIPAAAAIPPVQQLDRLNMLSLAIMLLEINVGKPIEDLRRSEDLASDGTLDARTDLFTANRWLETQMCLGHLTAAFTGAITYCLQCYLDPAASFGNYEFLKTVEDRVLEPLEREMRLLLYGTLAG